jgi:hypothetical protein
VLYYSVKYLHRHPSELNLTLDQMAEVAYIGDELDKVQSAAMGIFGG